MLNKRKTNDSLLDNNKCKIIQKVFLESKSNQEPQETKKIEEKIEFCMNNSQNLKESSLINYEKENIDTDTYNTLKSEEHDLKKSNNNNFHEPSKIEKDLRNSVEIFKLNNTYDLQNNNKDYDMNLRHEKIKQKNFSDKNLTEYSNKHLYQSNKSIDTQKYENTKTEAGNNYRNLVESNYNKYNKTKLLQNLSNRKNNRLLNNLAVDRSLKLNNSTKKKNVNLQIDIVPVISNLNSKINSLNKSNIANSLIKLTQESQLSTSENFRNTVSNFLIIANNSQINSNKTPIKNIDKKLNSDDKINYILSQNKTQNNLLKKNNLNQSNKKKLILIDFSDKNDFLNHKKSSEIVLKNSKLCNDKEINQNNYDKKFLIKNKNISIGNHEENYNSNINEHYFLEQTESDYLTYNKSISSEIEMKSSTNRPSNANYKHYKKLNDFLSNEKIKKSKSKNKMNVIRLPKKPLNKNKNLKIVINTIYDFHNKKNLGIVNNKKENAIITQFNSSNNNIKNKNAENPEKNINEENLNKISNNNNPLTATNARKKHSVAIYDFTNEESLFSKKNKSHTPNNRGDSNNTNSNEIQTNTVYSDKIKASFNFKKFNYVFGDGNSTTNKTSIFKSQNDLNNKSDQIIIKNNLNNFNENKINPKSNYSNQQVLANREMSDLIKKVRFDGDITNLKGRIKKN